MKWLAENQINLKSNIFAPDVMIGLREMTSFSPILNQDLEQGQLVAAVNSWK